MTEENATKNTSTPEAAADPSATQAMPIVAPKYGARTDLGCVREQNEDSLIAVPPLYVVADGMGGHDAGEIASEIAVQTVVECAQADADIDQLGKAVEIANREIINAAIAGKGSDGMGTTCTAAILRGRELLIAQVGDSRAYLLHDGVLSQITRDHSLMANMIEAGQLTAEEARFHPHRSVITRALGNDLSMVPDLYEIRVSPGDRLLLCSDGLTSMVGDQTIARIMMSHPNPQECADALVQAAMEWGGLDNITVIVVETDSDATPAAAAGMTRGTKIALGVTFVCLALTFILWIIGAAGFTGVF